MSGRRQQDLKRKYGFFRCSSCGSQWESAHVYCQQGTNVACYKQECKKCKIGYIPYRVENIVCSQCGKTSCTCDHRHSDPEKSHRSDLCEKCKSGRPCQQ